MNRLRARARGFTLLEVMIAIAILAAGLMGLLGLHHRSIQSVVRAQQMAQAAMLAQAVMTQAELERAPEQGKTQGDFQALFPGRFPGFRWERVVTASAEFPDVRVVQVRVFYGPNLRQSFLLTEYLHDPRQRDAYGNLLPGFWGPAT